MITPSFLLPETTVQENGAGPTLEIQGHTRAFLLTLGIEEAVEQASLSVTVAGSLDGTQWAETPLLSWPQKFYPGISALYLADTAIRPVQFLRAEWKMNRWGRGSKVASFRFYVFLEELLF